MFDIYTALDEIGHSTYRSEYAHQIRCPFHGNGEEVNPSARVYPETDSIYCWTCGKAWNPVAVIAQARGITYSQAKYQITSLYGGSINSGRQVARIDDVIADVVASTPYVDIDKREEAMAAVNEILYSACIGEPTWDLEEAVDSWRKQYFPRLSL